MEMISCLLCGAPIPRSILDGIDVACPSCGEGRLSQPPAPDLIDPLRLMRLQQHSISLVLGLSVKRPVTPEEISAVRYSTAACEFALTLFPSLIATRAADSRVRRCPGPPDYYPVLDAAVREPWGAAALQSIFRGRPLEPRDLAIVRLHAARLLCYLDGSLGELPMLEGERSLIDALGPLHEEVGRG